MTTTADASVRNRLRIAEIFASIQGEGQWVGVPSTFIRVSGCNLRCGWCDTPYASWEPEGPVLEVGEIVEQAIGFGTDHVVLTGGEPMLFHGIEPLARALKGLGKIITIETAGTVFRQLPCDLMSISPKLAGSAPDQSTGQRERHEAARANYEALERLVATYSHQLKFVVNPEGPDETEEIQGLLKRLPSYSAETPVYLMAEGRDAETLHRRERLLVPLCMQHGFRLTPRFQIDLFGDTRGT